VAISDRRAALRTLAAGAVGAATAPHWVESLSALARQQAEAHAVHSVIAQQDWSPQVFTVRQNDAIVALTELIIPATDTPGAKAARVNRFIDTVLSRALSAEREAFLRGLAWLDDRSRALFGKEVAAASAADQTALLTRISDERQASAEDKGGVDFFRALKSMTIDGYYTSEIGLRQELGDSGQLFLPKFTGCDHAEHQ
jgi:hypothetical protein